MDDEDEITSQTFHLELIQNIPSHLNFWLGGSDLNNYNIELVDQGWEWSDGSAFNFINWQSGMLLF